MPVHRTIFSYTPAAAYQIPADRHLYLDTSAIRRLGRKLSKWRRRDESFTSVLTIVELLNGITRTDSEFRFRQSAVVGLAGGEVAIDWQMPQFRLRCAFPPLREKYDIYEKRTECIKKLLHCLVNSRNRSEFSTQERKLRLEYDLKYFGTADEAISRAYNDASRKWVPYSRLHFRDPSTPSLLEMFGLSQDTPIAQAAARIAGSEFDFGFALFAITKAFTAQEHGTEEFHDQLFRSYDESIDLYILASSHQHWREIGRNDSPGRNTGVDLEHLLYVSPGSEVVTTDRGMSTAVSEAGGAVVGEEVFAMAGG